MVCTPDKNNENLKKKILFLARIMEIELDKYEINMTHKLGKRGQLISPAIIKLNNRDIEKKIIS